MKVHFSKEEMTDETSYIMSCAWFFRQYYAGNILEKNKIKICFDL